MKKIIIAVLALTLTFSMTGCYKLTELNLNEKTETTTTVIEGADVPDGVVITENKVDLGDGDYLMEELDERGNLICNRYYSADDTLQYYVTYEYNDMDLCTKEMHYDAEGNLDVYFEKEYNDKGLITKGSIHESDGRCSSYVTYEYDGNNNCIKEMNYDGTELLSYSVSEYNEMNLITKTEFFNPDGSNIYTDIYEYDENGNLTREAYYNENKELTGECIYKYDDNGDIVSEIRTDENGEKNLVYYERNGIYLVETWENEVGEILYKYEYENGVTKKEYFYKKGVLDYFEEHIEENGNHILIRTYVDETGTPTQSVTHNTHGYKEIEVYFDETGEVKDYYTYEYNGDWLVERCDYKNAAGDTLWFNTYEYDENLRLIKDSCYFPESELQSYQTMEYDEYGNEIKRSVYNADGTLKTYREMKYDDYGNLISFKDYNADGTPIF